MTPSSGHRDVRASSGGRVRHLSLWVLIGLAGVVLALVPPVYSAGPHATPASCAGVLVVVDPGDSGQATSACATSFDDGYQALASAGYRPTFTKGMICQIDTIPATCQVTMTEYWSYWHATRQPDGSYSPWTYSAVGAGSYTPAPGDVEGWFFGRAGKVAPRVNPEASPATIATIAPAAQDGDTRPGSATSSPAQPPSGSPAPPVGVPLTAGVLLLGGSALGIWWHRKGRHQ